VGRASERFLLHGVLGLALWLVFSGVTAAQSSRHAAREDTEFGPVVRAYLGYLRAQQEVVDDRVSRREIDRRYYAHNSNRIKALRQVAIRIARENDNDYLPELDAVSLNEFNQLFEDPLPDPNLLQIGETLNHKFRFVEAVTVQREKFFVFARLDPYEQAELIKQAQEKAKSAAKTDSARPVSDDSATRPRRTISP
jgi:hypothetical protein